jgi:hypothetical protein
MATLEGTRCPMKDSLRGKLRNSNSESRRQAERERYRVIKDLEKSSWSSRPPPELQIVSSSPRQGLCKVFYMAEPFETYGGKIYR